ncbi:hypothetical protein LJ753_16615 [Arthrobacter sp. zg-Y20]|uniref:hypothetical protein n=1 Tax=unclassified Arthrobacter TaxID=235627 RepID=UPI001D14FE61|nr:MULTISPECIES: hypothetical protein [unclassified Arthrobacter]MCC3277488.1 hypothetical protein [Arthrobacter sp. zg-Y20]MDK1317649.1 hypothetical protein [Arthrobacter sp. zg.Y20]WIB07091.1 hypothetical protein QNO06_05005 [Arthrobacter sp. zg-Y20]
MDIITSKPEQDEAVRLVTEFIGKAHDEWPGDGFGGYDYKFLIKQLEAVLFAIYPISERDFEDAVEQYGNLQDIKQLADTDIADFYDAPTYREGMRETRIRDTQSDYQHALNNILHSAGYKATRTAA